jgi:hypothetical protein
MTISVSIAQRREDEKALGGRIAVITGGEPTGLGLGIAP